MLKDDFTCYVLCSVSERIHSNLPEEAHVLVTLLKTKIHLINLNKSCMSHFTKVPLHDCIDLNMKVAFSERAPLERGWDSAIYHFILITVFSYIFCIFVGGRNRN